MSRLEELYALKEEAQQLKSKANSRAWAALSREYRAILREIEELEGENGDDEIASIIGRTRDGQAGADQAGSAAVRAQRVEGMP